MAAEWPHPWAVVGCLFDLSAHLPDALNQQEAEDFRVKLGYLFPLSRVRVDTSPKPRPREALRRVLWVVARDIGLPRVVAPESTARSNRVVNCADSDDYISSVQSLLSRVSNGGVWVLLIFATHEFQRCQFDGALNWAKMAKEIGKECPNRKALAVSDFLIRLIESEQRKSPGAR
jgi:hypothetical protein